MRQTQILLPDSLHEALRTRSFGELTSMGEPVRRAVEIYLGSTPNTPRCRPGKRGDAVRVGPRKRPDRKHSKYR